MPDLLTHTLVGLGVHKVKRINNLLIFLIGNISPDIVGRVPLILFPNLSIFFGAFHTFSAGIIIAFLFAHFFEESERKSIFLYFIAGIFFHLTLDLTQKNIFGYDYNIFSPFSYISFSTGFIWPDDTLYSIPVLLILLVILYKKQILRKISNFRK